MRWLSLLTLLLVGCTSVGPQALKQARFNYNLALQHSANEQLLLNLVRLRYRDNPVFLEVSSISSQFSLTSDLSAQARVNEVYPDSYTLGFGLAFAEKPTITLSPLQGDKFVKRLLSPIPVEHLVLLAHSGWRIDRILRLCVQRLNGLENAPTASGPTPELKPEFEDFLRAVKLIHELRRAKVVDFTYLPEKGKVLPALYVHPKRSLHPKLEELRQLLKLGPHAQYLLTTDVTVQGDRYLRVETRSLMGVLFYLSQGVCVPEEDLRAGKVTATRYPDGRLFDWSELLGDLFVVRVSARPPADAMVAVKYRGKWFYIADNDLRSKSTFVFLSQIFALEAGKEKSLVPLLTIPVGQ
ncbi:MAG: hypothetical protein GXO17_00505 [Thermodesulfobacteria bacterium]|nr:hypothetical protein [Thermodesulfobacteriota bacterium]